MLSKVLPTYCFYGGFWRLRCRLYRWMTEALSFSLINSSWQCCWGEQSYPVHTTVVCLHFSLSLFSAWILPCFCRKDREVGKHCYLWGSRRSQECSWFMPVKITYSALSSHIFSLLSTAVLHTLLSNVSCYDSVALRKLFCLSACLYPSCLSLLWHTNREKSYGGWNETVSKTLSCFSVGEMWMNKQN